MKRAACLIVEILLMATTAFAANGNLTVDGVIHSNGNHFNVLSYYMNSTPTKGIKIKTNIPFSGSAGMPTIILEGYIYSNNTPVSLMVTWYALNGGFISSGATSSGGHTPPIQLANENGLVVIFINDKRSYSRFSVRAYAKGYAEPDSWYEGWTAVDEDLTNAANIVSVQYKNSFKDTVSIDGNLFISGNSTSSGLKITSNSVSSLETVARFVNPNTQNGSGVQFLLGPYADNAMASISSAGNPSMTHASNLWLRPRIAGGALGQGVYISPTDNVGIGTSTPAPDFKLQVMGSVASNNTVLTSDAKFKKNLQPITSPLEKLLNLNGLSYEWKTDEYRERNFQDGRHYGVIAQEIEKVLPEVVSTASDGTKSVAYTEIIPVLIEAIKEQQKVIKKQQAEIAEIKKLVLKSN